MSVNKAVYNALKQVTELKNNVIRPKRTLSNILFQFL